MSIKVIQSEQIIVMWIQRLAVTIIWLILPTCGHSQQRQFLSCDRNSIQVSKSYQLTFGQTVYLVVLLDDVLRSQSVVLQIAGQVKHVLRQLFLQVVVVLQDGVQLSSRLTLIQRKTSAQR